MAITAKVFSVFWWTTGC